MPDRSRRARRLRLASALVAWLSLSATAGARVPPVAMDPKEGLWFAQGELYVHQTRDKWSVFSAGATVNRLAVDGQHLWLATDDGALRLDTQSRGLTRFTMDDGLPSQAVTAVAVDERYVWLGTNKGLLRYRKSDREKRLFTEDDGLPHRAVNDLRIVGPKLWVATRGGLGLYDPEVDSVRGFTAADGLGADEVLELFQVGEDLFCRTEAGLARFRPKTRTFTLFGLADLGGSELRTFVLDGERIWVGTEAGLRSIELTSDSVLPFQQQAALRSTSIVGVEVASEYLFITTDQEVVQFHKANRSLKAFTEADGLLRREGALGTAMTGGLLTVLFSDGAWVYELQRELWTPRALAVTQVEKRSTARVFGRLNAELPYDVTTRKLSDERFATAEGGVGLSHRFDDQRTLDVSGRLDYGQLELPGLRDLQAKVEYRGAPTDVLREVRGEDRHPYRTLEEGLDPTLLLRGGEVRLASPENRLATTPAGGLRRGLSARDFLRGGRTEVLALTHRYVLPGSERVWVDGELLTAGVDYTVIYPAGQLAFLDPERVDELSLIEVEYEFDLVAKKGLGALSVLDLLPADREVGDWTRSGEARLVSEESGLYAQIDGAAPKYIDRGWVKSVFAEYRQGGRTLQVAVHDLGQAANAQQLYDFDLPAARELVEGREGLVLDLGLSSSYAARAVASAYYIELSIDEKSDAAKQSLKLFALQVLDRGTGAGAHAAQERPEWLWGARAAVRPTEGLELGARAVHLASTASDGRRLLSGFADARYERSALGGLFTAYGEAAATDGQSPSLGDGFAGVARLRYAHPRVEGLASARLHSEGYEPLGTAATRDGRLAEEVRAQATAYPATWLPVSGFFFRQRSRTEDGGAAALQHAQARVQLSREKLPTASLQLGHALEQGPLALSGRLRGVAQAEYDFAQGILAGTGMKRLSVRGLYSYAAASTDEGAGVPRGDRVELARLELRAAPTSTESAYALFRSRSVLTQPPFDERPSLAGRRWELNSGARSTIIPGLVPAVNYSAWYDDDRVTQPLSARSGKAVAAASLGILPGAWATALAPLVLEPRVALSGDDKAEGGLKSQASRTLRLDNRAVWAGAERIEVELFELYEQAAQGAELSVHSRKLELRNRLVVRPTARSPLTFRLNHQRLEARNDLSLSPEAPEWGTQSSYEGVAEWLMRWTQVLTTRLRGTYAWGETKNVLVADATGTGGLLQSFVQHRLGGELELRLLFSGERSRLFLLQRDRVFRLFGQGGGASQAVGYETSLGLVCALGEALFVDSEVTWRQTFCLGSPCTATKALEPRVLLTFEL